MNTTKKLSILAALAATVVVVIVAKREPAVSTTGKADPAPAASAPVAGPLPQLLDLGAGKCIPCKMMVPVLEELKRDYAGRLDVQFLDVWQNPNFAKQFHVEAIPTQIFFDARGREVFRHVGFFSKEDILKKWSELGVDLEQDQ